MLDYAKLQHDILPKVTAKLFFFSLDCQYFYTVVLTVINTKRIFTADRLAQLIERQTTMREVSGSSPRPDQHSGS